jgi:two-component system response regulator FlrC
MTLCLDSYESSSATRISLKHHWFDRLADVVRAAGGTDNLPENLKDWPRKYADLSKWLSDAATALSPSQVLDLPSFAAWPDDFLEDRKAALHRRFLARWKELFDQCSQKLVEVDQLLAPLFDPRTPTPWRSIAIDRLADSLSQAARCLSQLPDQVEWPEELPPKLPIILVVDDELGRKDARYKELRRALCHRFHLKDAVEPSLSILDHPVALAYFCPGQRWEDTDGYVNDLSLIQRWIEQGPESFVRPAQWSLILVDIRFTTGKPDAAGDGLSSTPFGLDRVIPWIKQHHHELPIVALTSEKRDETITAIRATGASYISREDGTEVDVLHHIIEGRRASAAQLRTAMGIPDDFVAQDSKMITEVLFPVWQAARDKDQVSVLLLGESGAGKECLATFIHNMSPRMSGLFRRFNCSNLTEELADSILFGFYRGAFHLAEEDTEGEFQKAHGGGILLDEFADLPATVQAKLLRTLEPKQPFNRPVEPVGQPQRRSTLRTLVDVRVICATNKGLADVRSDLVGRLPAKIVIPPLRERPGDIVPLARYFLASPQRLNSLGITLAPDACTYLESLDLNGNARELEQILSAAILGKGKRNVLTKDDLEAAYSTVHPHWSGAGRPKTPKRLVDTTEITAPPAVRHGPSPPDDLPTSVACLLDTPEKWKSLSMREMEAIDKQLRGHIGGVLATLIQWAVFRCGPKPDAPSVAQYLTGAETEKKGRLPQDILRRFLSPDGVARQVLVSSYWPQGGAFDTIAKRASKTSTSRKNKPPS